MRYNKDISIKKVVAVITARKNSKGIPNKNRFIINGKPLICWTIEAAKKSLQLDDIIVTSDDKYILKIAEQYGVLWVKRPKRYATDSSSSENAVIHSLNYIRKKLNYTPEVVVLLQPTSPTRTNKDIDDAIKAFLNNDCLTLISGYEPEKHPLKNFIFDKKGYLNEMIKGTDPLGQRQKLIKVFCPNGAIFITYVTQLLKSGRFLSKRTIPFYMDKAKSIDIDSIDDLRNAEKYLKDHIDSNAK